jgi:acyl-coenzyme A thioesterase PaaI-like protein
MVAGTYGAAMTSSTAIPDLIHGSQGFVATLGPRVLSVDPARLRLDAGPELHNHLGGPHAAAIFGLGETTAFVVLLRVFGDLVAAGAVPLVKSSQIGYSAVATGPLLAEGQLTGDETSARRAFEEKGRATFDVGVRFRREADEVETAVATYVMALRAG